MEKHWIPLFETSRHYPRFEIAVLAGDDGYSVIVLEVSVIWDSGEMR